MTAVSVWQVFSKNARWFLVGAIAVVLSILSLLLANRNSKIKKLQNDLLFYKVQLQLKELAAKNNATMHELQQLQILDAELDTQISAIVNRVHVEIRGTMTAEEIAARFREIGIMPKDM